MRGGALGHHGAVVVSGLALGIDGAAHRGTLASGGVGVTVLGSGPDVWYPPEHASLGEDLLAAGGSVISEYPPGSPPHRWHFPSRNRIIAGLSGLVLVVEAERRSGTMIAAGFARSQGRTLLSSPKGGAGCQQLLRDGARKLVDAEGVVRAARMVGLLEEGAR